MALSKQVKEIGALRNRCTGGCMWVIASEAFNTTQKKCPHLVGRWGFHLKNIS